MFYNLKRNRRKGDVVHQLDVSLFPCYCTLDRTNYSLKPMVNDLFTHAGDVQWLFLPFLFRKYKIIPYCMRICVCSSREIKSMEHTLLNCVHWHPQQTTMLQSKWQHTLYMTSSQLWISFSTSNASFQTQTQRVQNYT